MDFKEHREHGLLLAMQGVSRQSRVSSRCKVLAQNESAPENRGAPFELIDEVVCLGSGFLLDHLGLAVAIADGNLARLLGLGNLADEIDVQETVLQRRALYLDEIGKLEYALKSARRDALIEHLAGGLVVLGLLLTANRQGVFLRLDRQVSLGKARDGYRDTVVVLAGPLDIVGRVTGSGAFGDLIEEGKQTVETDGGPIEGSKIESTHVISSLSDMWLVRPNGPDRGMRRPEVACANSIWGAVGAAKEVKNN